MLRTTLVLTALALVASPYALAAEGGCHAISGTHVDHNVPCAVTALACVESELTGDLAGTSTTIITTFDLATRTYTGTRTNFLANGAVIDYSIVGTFANGIGRSVSTITGGTRQFEHATGDLMAESVNAIGTYSGEYCLGNSKEVEAE